MTTRDEWFKLWWPKGLPVPTDEQWSAAEIKMHRLADESYKNGYQGDWGFTLHLTVGTYAPATWVDLFEYIDEDVRNGIKDKFHKEIDEILKK